MKETTAHMIDIEKKDMDNLGIEDATKPTFETTVNVTDLKKAPEVFPELKEGEVRTWEEKLTYDDEGALKNVRVEASLTETINLGNMEFYKIMAGISGDVGKNGREAAWKEAWREVETQKAEELIKLLKARARR